MDKKFVFEVETCYKSGVTRTDIISADSEEEMWQIYDKHHNSEKIEFSAVVDSWIQ